MSKYRHLTDLELVTLVQFKHSDLIDELCDRLVRATLAEPNIHRERMQAQMSPHTLGYPEYANP